MGIPLDVRHVTLSSGTLGGAMPVLGVEFLKTPEFWRAVVGIFFIGALNVGVSFGLALLVAIKARGVNPPQRRAIRRAVRKRFFSSPLSFFFACGLHHRKVILSSLIFIGNQPKYRCLALSFVNYY